MKNSAIQGRLFTAALTFLLVVAFTPAFSAQSGIFGLRSADNDGYMAVSGGSLTTADSMSGDNAKWDFEKTEDNEYFRIRSVGADKYLHIENGALELGDIEPGWWSAQWILDSVGTGTFRIKNRWQTNRYILMWNNTPKASEIHSGMFATWAHELEAGEVLQSSNSEPVILPNGEDSESKTAGDYAKVAVDETVKYVGQGGEAIVHGGKVVYGGAKTAYEETEKFVTGGETPEGRKAIKFNNQAGYVAKMQVMYIVKKDIGGTMVKMPETQETSNITLGFTRPIVLPENLATDAAVRIFITGVGTTTNPVYTTEIPGTFTGVKCYKAWGTFASAEGGGC